MCPAVSCAERGLKSHLLLRGEKPEILTGYNLVSTVYGNVTYVPRSFYAHREKMLQTHASMVAGNSGNVVYCNDIIDASNMSQTFNRSEFVQMDAPRDTKCHSTKVVIVNEGAGDAVALLGKRKTVDFIVAYYHHFIIFTNISMFLLMFNVSQSSQREVLNYLQCYSCINTKLLIFKDIVLVICINN